MKGGRWGLKKGLKIQITLKAQVLMSICLKRLAFLFSQIKALEVWQARMRDVKFVPSVTM